MSSQPSYLRYFQEPASRANKTATSPSLGFDGQSSRGAGAAANSDIYMESDAAPPSPYDYRRSAPPRAPMTPSALGQDDASGIGASGRDRSGSTSIVPDAYERTARAPSPSRRAAEDDPNILSAPGSPVQIDETTGSPKSSSKSTSIMPWLRSKKGTGNSQEPMAKDKVNLINPQRTLSKELKNLVNNPDFCDVVFVLEDKPLYAHRAILAARSQKFQQMFNNIKEPRPEVTIPNIRFPVFLGMLYFLYTDSVDISLEYTLELMGAAAQFGLDLLKSLCERVLEGSIHVENVCWIFQGADKYKASRLRDICLRFITRNFDLVSKSISFMELDRELILEIIKSR